MNPPLPSPWILGRAHLDIFWLICPGIVWLFVTWFWSPSHGSLGAMALLLTASVIDAGHVHTTLWRMWWPSASGPTLLLYAQDHTSQAPQQRRFYYAHFMRWQAPILCGCLLFLFCIFLDARSLLRIFVYATLVHHVRQYQGILHWYSKQNGRACFVTELCAVSVMVICLVGYHVKPGAQASFFTPFDFMMFPHLPTYWVCNGLLWCLGAVFFAHEIAWRNKNKCWTQELNRTLTFASLFFVYGFGLLWGSQLNFGLMSVAHGIPYLALMTLSVHRLKGTKPAAYTPTTWALLLGAWAVATGLLDQFLSDKVTEYINRFPEKLPWTWAALTAAVFTPLAMHYAWDTVIWKRRDPQFTRILGFHK